MIKKLRAVIIDDEKLAREILKTWAAEINDKLEIVAECRDGFEGIKAVSDKKPDLVFLDIQMPKLSGFEMLELVEEPPEVIFTTAYDEYAIKAFEVNAVDYLLKPFPKERFFEAVQKVTERNKLNSGKKGYGKLIEDASAGKEYLERIAVKSGQKIEIIPVESVQRIESEDDYVRIVTEKGKYLKNKTMRSFQNSLEPGMFVRIHRSSIINIEYLDRIELFEKDSYRARMKDGTLLPVSRSGYGRLKDILGDI